ncbi:PAC2 family protein [Dictyobacter formicarum]|nr:PAC2 family protein [Dictyobacter formicarum]
MSQIHYYNQPELREPIVVVAFGGWNDAADSATTAIKFLIDRWLPEKIAEIDAEDFFVFTETRPTIKYVDGVQRSITWPANQFFAHAEPEFNRDVILFLGTEPQLKWKTFCAAFLDVCKKFHVSEVVFLGALLADVPHSITVPITGASADNDIMERLQEMDVNNSRYEGPTGMIGVLHDACHRAQISSATLWAAAPHYLAATPNIKVTAALLTYLNQFLSFGLDLHEIQSEAVRFEEQVTALVAKDPEAREYVRRLEEQIANGVDLDDSEEDEEELMIDPDRSLHSGPLPSADSLIRDVEALLREQRGSGQSQQSDDEEESE